MSQMFWLKQKGRISQKLIAGGEGAGEREREREREQAGGSVCVYVSEREKARERGGGGRERPDGSQYKRATLPSGLSGAKKTELPPCLTSM